MKGQGKEMDQEPSAAKGQINKFNQRKPTPAALPSNGIEHQAHMSEKDINVSRNLIMTKESMTKQYCTIIQYTFMWLLLYTL